MFISAIMVVFQVFEYRHDYRELSSYMREQRWLKCRMGAFVNWTTDLWCYCTNWHSCGYTIAHVFTTCTANGSDFFAYNFRTTIRRVAHGRYAQKANPKETAIGNWKKCHSCRNVAFLLNVGCGAAGVRGTGGVRFMCKLWTMILQNKANADILRTEKLKAMRRGDLWSQRCAFGN